MSSTESGSPPDRVRVREWPSGKLRREFGMGQGTCLIFSADGTLAARFGPWSRLWVFDVDTGRPARIDVEDMYVVAAAFRPGTSEILLVDAGDQPPRLRRWDIRPGGAVEVGSFPVPGLQRDGGLAVSPDGRWLATLARSYSFPVKDGGAVWAPSAGRFHLWDLQSGTLVAAPDLGTDTSTHLRFLTDNVLVAVGWQDGAMVVRHWDARRVSRPAPGQPAACAFGAVAVSAADRGPGGVGRAGSSTGSTRRYGGGGRRRVATTGRSARSRSRGPEPSLAGRTGHWPRIPRPGRGSGTLPPAGPPTGRPAPGRRSKVIHRAERRIRRAERP